MYPTDGSGSWLCNGFRQFPAPHQFLNQGFQFCFIIFPQPFSIVFSHFAKAFSILLHPPVDFIRKFLYQIECLRYCFAVIYTPQCMLTYGISCHTFWLLLLFQSLLMSSLYIEGNLRTVWKFRPHLGRHMVQFVACMAFYA